MRGHRFQSCGKRAVRQGEKRYLNAPGFHIFWSDRLKARKHNPALAVVSYFTFNLKRGVKQDNVVKRYFLSLLLGPYQKVEDG